MKKLLIVDGNSIMNRAFYGVRPLVTSDGVHTNAVYGYLNILKKHLDAIKPDFVAVAFDLKAPTFRHKMFDAYKAGRHQTPDELLSQIPLIKEATRCLGIATVSKEGYEADDILGTLSSSFEGESFIVTGDRDSFQLVSDKTTVILASTGGDESFTPKEIVEKYSLPPKKLIEVKALAGDSSDNIPGVSGVGEKTAIKLILEAGSVENLYKMIDEGKIKLSDSQKNKLLSDRENAFLSRRLAEITLDVPDLPEMSALLQKEVDKEALRALFVRLEFTKLMSRFDLDTPPEKKKREVCEQLSFDSEEEEKSEIIALSADDFLLEINEELVPLDLVGDNFYYEKEKKVFSTPFSLDLVEKFITAKKTLSLFDSKALWLKCGEAEEGLDESLVAFDIQLASYLDNPDSRGDFSRIVMAYLKKSTPPFAESDPEVRAGLIRPLTVALTEKIKEGSLEKLYYEVELPLSKVLAGMEMRGFGADREDIEDYGRVLKEKIGELQDKIFSLTGEVFNINSPKQLGEVLFEKMALPHKKKKTKTLYSTDAETLEKLRFYSPVVDHILEYRHLSKLYGTYIEGLLKVIHPDGRIRTSFNQKQTQTGRLSSAEPNLQNIPVRTPEGREIRRFFKADEGKVLIDADYSQIELRVLAHVSGDKNLIDAFNSGTDVHSVTASKVFSTPIEEVTPTLRSRAKAVNFGIVYGMGEFSLSEDLKVSINEAKNYINGYFATYTGVKRYLDETVKSAYERGFVSTLWGRKRYIPELTGTKHALRAFGERVAKNSPIQGTSADLIKLAMVKTDRRLKKEGLEARLILQVHDELIIEAPEKEADYVSALLKEEMEGVLEMAVSLTVDVGIGKSWYDAKK